jgi:hypothetical protein
MKSPQMTQVRLERTDHELQFLCCTIKSWLDHRRLNDRNEKDEYVGRHKTQLESIDSTLIGALQTLKGQLDGLILYLIYIVV